MTFNANFQERNLCTALSGKKIPARGPYRKKLDRSRARDKPIKFGDLGIRPAQMLEKKINGGYYMPARGYEFYLREFNWLYLMSEPSERVGY